MPTFKTWMAASLRFAIRTIQDVKGTLRTRLQESREEPLQGWREFLVAPFSALGSILLSLVGLIRIFAENWKRILIGTLLTLAVFGPLTGAGLLLELSTCVREREATIGGHGTVYDGTLTPTRAIFGDAIHAEYYIMTEVGNAVHADEIVFAEPDFSPYVIIGEPITSREVVCEQHIIRWSATIKCLGSFEDPGACLPAQHPNGFSFPVTKVTFTYEKDVTKGGKVIETFTKDGYLEIPWPILFVSSLSDEVDAATAIYDPGPDSEPKAPRISTPLGPISYETAGEAVILLTAILLIAGLLLAARRFLLVPAEAEDEPQWLIAVRSRLASAEAYYETPPGEDHYAALHALALALRDAEDEQLNAFRPELEALAHPRGVDDGEATEAALARLTEMLEALGDEEGRQ